MTRLRPPTTAAGLALRSIAIFLLFALLLATIFLLGGAGQLLDDYDARRADAASRADAERTAQAAARFERAAQALCGPNAAWRMTEGGGVWCMTKRGRHTRTVKAEL